MKSVIKMSSCGLCGKPALGSKVILAGQGAYLCQEHKHEWETLRDTIILSDLALDLNARAEKLESEWLKFVGGKGQPTEPNPRKKVINDPKESSIVNTILKNLNALPGCYAEKEHGGMYGKRGKPDIHGCIKLTRLDMNIGRAFFFEVKTSRGKTTPAQDEELEKWAATGAIVGVVRSWGEVRNILMKEGAI